MNTTKNIDPVEVEKFEALASRWWDKDSEFKPLHDINPLRIRYIAERCELQDKEIIDIGCGGGILTEGLAQQGARMTGIDAGEAPINVAKLHILESGLDIQYTQSLAEEWSDNKVNHYDAITCLEMLEHVPDPGSVIKACAKMAKPGANLFFSTINRNPKSYLFMVIGAEQVLKLLPKGTHDYKKFIRPSELARWIREAGLLLKDTRGMTYNPITQNYKMGNDIDVNYIVHAVKPR